MEEHELPSCPYRFSYFVEVVELLLCSLSDADTVVRWAAAKGIGWVPITTGAACKPRSICYASFD